MDAYLESLGCRVNRSEIGDLADRFLTGGNTLTARPEEADLIIINTCAVTGAAELATRYRSASVGQWMDVPWAQRRPDG